MLDTEIVINYLKNSWKISEEYIYVLGRSLGSLPAYYLASKFEINGLLIWSGFKDSFSIKNYLRLNFEIPEEWNNFKYIQNAKCKAALIIHGVNDNFFPYEEIIVCLKELQKKCTSISTHFPKKMTHNSFDYEFDIVT